MYEIAYYGDDGCIRHLGDTHLKHYNHNHDRLGRFASSGGSARSAQRGLRKLERHRVATLGREMKADYKARKSMEKSVKINNNSINLQRKGKKTKRNDQKLIRSLEKYKENERKYKEYESNRKETEAFINKAISNAEKNGYTVSSKHVSMSSQRGMDFVNEYIGSYLIGPAAGMAKRKRQHEKYGERWNNQTPTYISANKYKVRG